MKKIKIAQIGLNTNSHAGQVFESMKKQNDLFEIAGYVLPENERERIPYKLNCLEGYPELTLKEVLENPEIEAVTIETDEIYLTKYAQMAAEHGKNIHMEKPGGASLPEFERLIETVKKNGKVFHIGYMYRYNPYVQELLAKVKSGDLGHIISVEAQMNCYHGEWVRQWLQELPGGMMFFLGCHLVDLILQIKGMPERIIPFNKSTGQGVTEAAKDFGMAVLEYPDGVCLAKTSALEPGGFLRRQLVVTGTKGMVELKPLERLEGDGQYTHRAEYLNIDWNLPPVESDSAIVDRYDGMMSAFAHMAAGEMENPYTCEYELALYRIILQCCGGN